MKVAKVFIKRRHAGYLVELKRGENYFFKYDPEYSGTPVSLTMPTQTEKYKFENFPAFFDGLLPEGPQLEGLLRRSKIDKDDYFSQLIAVGSDLVGAVTVEECSDEKVPDHLR